MIDVKAAPAREENDTRMMARRNATRRKPHSNIGRAAPDERGDKRGAAQAVEEGANLHTVCKVPTRFADNNPQDDNEPAPEYDLFHPREVGRRLKLLRRALEVGSSIDIAAQLDIDGGRWRNWEAGTALMPPQVAQRVAVLYPDFCLNYLYLGTYRNVSFALAQLLRSEERRLDMQIASKVRRRG